MASYPPMKLVSFFLEILPLAGFFLGYEFFGLFAAAVISVGLGALVMVANWLHIRRLARFAFFGTQFHLTAPTWFLLSRRWGLFFLCFAIANELVWRNASDADWVAFKTFIAAPASVLFMMAQLPLTLRGRIADTTPDGDQ